MATRRAKAAALLVRDAAWVIWAAARECIGERIHRHAHTTAHLTWEQTAGGTVRTARSTRGNTETRAGPNGEIGGLLSPT